MVKKENRIKKEMDIEDLGCRYFASITNHSVPRYPQDMYC